jgi:hypothetical protein
MYLADWIIVVSNVLRRLTSEQVFVILRSHW